MEDTLRAYNELPPFRQDNIVLILVLMEDTLRDLNYWDIARNNDVLILVLMEDTLRV